LSPRSAAASAAAVRADSGSRRDRRIGDGTAWSFSSASTFWLNCVYSVARRWLISATRFLRCIELRAGTHEFV
jgi:hypothetical protein